MTQMQKLTLFYDASCPLCEAEIIYLSRRNQSGLLAFVDIHSPHFDPLQSGISCQQAMDAMYGQYEDGTLIKGVEVFAQSYRRANMKVLAWVFSRKTLRPLLNYSYYFFARNRHAISKRIGPLAKKLVG
jgi:hypothetical protein